MINVSTSLKLRRNELTASHRITFSCIQPLTQTWPIVALLEQLHDKATIENIPQFVLLELATLFAYHSINTEEEEEEVRLLIFHSDEA